MGNHSLNNNNKNNKNSNTYFEGKHRIQIVDYKSGFVAGQGSSSGIGEAKNGLGFRD